MADQQEYQDSYQDESAALRRVLPWGRIALACVFAFLVLAVVLFVWNRWYRFDDAIDLQGVWRDSASGTSMEVDATHLRLASDVVYDYTIDTAAKTISYTFGSGLGTSSYRFSEDRKTVILEDGGKTDWGLVMHFRDDTAFTDATLPEGTSRLVKESDDVPAIVVPGSGRDYSAAAASALQGGASSGSSDAAAGGQDAGAGAAGQGGAAESTLGWDATEQSAQDYEQPQGYYDEDGNWVELDYADESYGAGEEGQYAPDAADGQDWDDPSYEGFGEEAYGEEASVAEDEPAW